MSHATAEEAREHSGRTLSILAIAALAYSLAQTMVIPALPEIQDELGVSATDVTWMLTAFLVVSAVSTPILGRLGDMYGKERMLLIAITAFGLGGLVSALGHSMPVYIAGRGIQGLGGGIFPLAIGIIRDEFPRARVAHGIGLISAMLGIGGGVGLAVSGALIGWLGVDSIFWITVVIAGIAAVATFIWVPESPIRVPARVDYVGAVLMSLALVGVLLGVSEGNSWGWTATGTLALILGGLVMGAIFAWWEERIDEPLIDLKLMRLRTVWTTNLSAFLIGFALFGSYVLIPQLVQTDPDKAGYGFGSGVTLSGVYLIPSALMMLFASPLSARMSMRMGSRIPLAIGALSSAIGYFMLVWLHSEPWQILASGVLLGFGIGMAYAAMANLIASAVPRDQTGVATGVNTVVRTVGGAIGAQLTAALLTASVLADGTPKESGYVAAFLLSAVGGLFAVGATLLVPKGAGGADAPLPGMTRAETEALDAAAVMAAAEGAGAPYSAQPTGAP